MEAHLDEKAWSALLHDPAVLTWSLAFTFSVCVLYVDANPFIQPLSISSVTFLQHRNDRIQKLYYRHLHGSSDSDSTLFINPLLLASQRRLQYHSHHQEQ